jgi:DNA-binding transcriptional LysR family regulator
MNIKSFDLNLLLAFESLMIERNVTRAARRSGLSQPAMSNALGRLRRVFDDPLLLRTRDGMKPTPVAHSLMAPVQAALEGLRSALEERPAFDAAASRRTFHLLANDYAEIVVLAPMLSELQANAGGLTLKIDRVGNLFQPPAPSSLADLYDLALGFFPEMPSLDPSLRSDLLWEERNVCIARAGHASIRGKLSLRQYATAHHAVVFYKSEGPGVIDTLLQQKGLSRRSMVLVPHFASAAFMVAASDVIATIPERLARQLKKGLNLQVLDIPLAIPPFRLMMLWHARGDVDPAHAWLRRLISATAASRKG